MAMVGGGAENHTAAQLWTVQIWTSKRPRKSDEEKQFSEAHMSFCFEALLSKVGFRGGLHIGGKPAYSRYCFHLGDQILREVPKGRRIYSDSWFRRLQSFMVERHRI